MTKTYFERLAKTATNASFTPIKIVAGGEKISANMRPVMIADSPCGCSPKSQPSNRLVPYDTPTKRAIDRMNSRGLYGKYPVIIRKIANTAIVESP
jgi:hypothetical protein